MAKTNHSWKELKLVLEGFPKGDLIGLVQDLYRLSANNKTFLDTRFLNHGRPSREDLKPYKARIRRAVCPAPSGKHGIRLSDGRRAIGAFKKAHGHAGALLELMVYYVSCGNETVLEYDELDRSFYESMISMFGDIVTLLNREGDPKLMDEFVPKLALEINRLDEHTEWGYADALRDCAAEIDMS